MEHEKHESKAHEKKESKVAEKKEHMAKKMHSKKIDISELGGKSKFDAILKNMRSK